MASHSSGIAVSDSLRSTFGSVLQGESDTRILQVKIENETQLECVKELPCSGSWEEDLGQVEPLLEPKTPCYVIFRTDEKGASGYKFLFFCYVPDKAKVRPKMLYASTRAVLRLQLLASSLKDEVFGTVPSDFSQEGYKQHVNSKEAPVPLTMEEQVKKEEFEEGGIYVGGSSSYIHGVAFPVEEKVTDAFGKLKSGEVNYVTICIDPNEEKVLLEGSKNAELGSLKDCVPVDKPLFHFFKWSHNHEGESFESIVYIYSCPDGAGGTKAAPVKLRMLYSSSKANVEAVAKQCGIEINGKLEINHPDDANEEAFMHLLHPKKVEKKKAFAKPRRPGKGGRRLIKK